jgi:hypothetical protein
LNNKSAKSRFQKASVPVDGMSFLKQKFIIFVLNAPASLHSHFSFFPPSNMGV